jgi:hypothetical protein
MEHFRDVTHHLKRLLRLLKRVLKVHIGELRTIAAGDFFELGVSEHADLIEHGDLAPALAGRPGDHLCSPVYWLPWLVITDRKSHGSHVLYVLAITFSRFTTARRAPGRRHVAKQPDELPPAPPQLAPLAVSQLASHDFCIVRRS